jgi:hypothetical protein
MARRSFCSPLSSMKISFCRFSASGVVWKTHIAASQSLRGFCLQQQVDHPLRNSLHPSLTLPCMSRLATTPLQCSMQCATTFPSKRSSRQPMNIFCPSSGLAPFIRNQRVQLLQQRRQVVL